jgi:hypothetical protein
VPALRRSPERCRGVFRALTREVVHTSVFAKSSPTYSNGTPSDRARPYENTSPKFRLAG